MSVANSRSVMVVYCRSGQGWAQTRRDFTHDRDVAPVRCRWVCAQPQPDLRPSGSPKKDPRQDSLLAGGSAQTSFEIRCAVSGSVHAIRSPVFSLLTERLT